MKIKFLKAFNGDAIFMTHRDANGATRNILVDGGVSQTYLQQKNSKSKRQYGELKEVIEGVRVYSFLIIPIIYLAILLLLK